MAHELLKTVADMLKPLLQKLVTPNFARLIMKNTKSRKTEQLGQKPRSTTSHYLGVDKRTEAHLDQSRFIMI